jgi:hypothetical protein
MALLSRERGYERLQRDAVPASGHRLQLQSQSAARGNRADRSANRTLGAAGSPVQIAARLPLSTNAIASHATTRATATATKERFDAGSLGTLALSRRSPTGFWYGRLI